MTQFNLFQLNLFSDDYLGEFVRENRIRFETTWFIMLKSFASSAFQVDISCSKL